MNSKPEICTLNYIGQTHHSKVHILQKTNTDFPGKFKGMQVSISSILCVQVIIFFSLKEKLGKNIQDGLIMARIWAFYKKL